MAYAKFARLNKAEKPYLPNPYYVNPESLFVWKADEILEEVEIAVKGRTAKRVQIEAAVIENYGLNRLELKQLRYEFYESFSIHKEAVKNPKVPQELRAKAQAKVDKMKLPKAPFAGMIRYFDSQ